MAPQTEDSVFPVRLVPTWQPVEEARSGQKAAFFSAVHLHGYFGIPRRLVQPIEMRFCHDIPTLTENGV
jgi:hypothetical protein